MAFCVGRISSKLENWQSQLCQRNCLRWSHPVAQRQSAAGSHRLHEQLNSSVVDKRVCRTFASESSSASTSSSDSSIDNSEIGIHEVETLRGVRANLDGQDPIVEYRVHWKDGSSDTWELASNLSPDLIRDFDERWWAAAKKGDVEVMTSMLRHSRTILSQVVDDNRRSALHFVCAIGSVKCVKLLVDAGADLNLQDREGYTPLHMACGYMQTGAMTALLEAGADPLIKDKQGRDVVSLVDNLRKSMPPNVAALQRIMALEQVASGLTDRLYEEVEPNCILDERSALQTEGKEYLVQYKDDIPDEWVHESLIAQDLLDDWNKGLERAPVAALLDVQQWGTSREYLVQWADGAPDSWESEDSIPPTLIEELQQQQPELFKGLKLAKGKQRRRKARVKAAQQSPSVDHSSSNGSSDQHALSANGVLASSAPGSISRSQPVALSSPKV